MTWLGMLEVEVNAFLVMAKLEDVLKPEAIELAYQISLNMPSRTELTTLSLLCLVSLLSIFNKCTNPTNDAVLVHLVTISSVALFDGSTLMSASTAMNVFSGSVLIISSR